MTQIRIGLIGCGGIGCSVHLHLLSRMPGVALVAVADPDPDRLLGAAQAGIPATTNTDAILSRADIDAVVIAAPPLLHALLAISALDRGWHVYLEKPLAASLSDGQAIVDAWNKPGRRTRVGMVGFNYRFNPLVRQARALLSAGAIGRAVSARTVFSIARRQRPAWAYSADQGGGPLLEVGSHHVDLVSYLFRSPVVEATAHHPTSASDTTVALRLRLENGVHVHSTFSIDGVDDDRIEIVGESGTLAVDRYRAWHVHVTRNGSSAWRDRLRKTIGGLRGSPHLVRKLRSPYHEPSYRFALRHFLDAIDGKHSASPDLADGYRALKVIVAATHSLTRGQPSVL